MNERWKTLLPVILGIVFALGAYEYGRSEKQKALDLRESLRSALAESESSLEKESDEIETRVFTALQAVDGVDRSRIKKDEAFAGEIFRKMLTWDSFASYNENRNALMESGISEDSQVMKTFMPKMVEIPAVTALSGQEYPAVNEIDAYGLNSQFDDMENTLISADGDVYRYFAVVKFSSMNKGGFDGSSKAAVIYALDQNQNVLEMDASGIVQ